MTLTHRGVKGVVEPRLLVTNVGIDSFNNTQHYIGAILLKRGRTMAALSCVQKVLVQFKLSGPLETHSFPVGIAVSRETQEQGTARRARSQAHRGEMLEFDAPVSADFIRDRLVESGFVLTKATGQERLAKVKNYTVVSFEFNRSGDGLDQSVESYLDDLAMRFWTRHYGFVHAEEGRLNLRFEMQGQFPKRFELEEPNELGVAKVTNTAISHRRKMRSEAVTT